MTARKYEGTNPFGLTAAECRVMSALVRLGSITEVVRELKYASKRTPQRYLTSAMRKMQVSNRVLAALKWDRSVRDGTVFVGYTRARNSVFDVASP